MEWVGRVGGRGEINKLVNNDVHKLNTVERLLAIFYFTDFRFLITEISCRLLNRSTTNRIFRHYFHCFNGGKLSVS